MCHRLSCFLHGEWKKKKRKYKTGVIVQRIVCIEAIRLTKKPLSTSHYNNNSLFFLAALGDGGRGDHHGKEDIRPRRNQDRDATVRETGREVFFGFPGGRGPSRMRDWRTRSLNCQRRKDKEHLIGKEKRKKDTSKYHPTLFFFFLVFFCQWKRVHPKLLLLKKLSG